MRSTVCFFSETDYPCCFCEVLMLGGENSKERWSSRRLGDSSMGPTRRSDNPMWYLLDLCSSLDIGQRILGPYNTLIDTWE